MNNKKMLAILGSPRKNGNAAKMLDVAVQIGKKSGYDVDVINLYEKNISYCNGCMKCINEGVCIINDDIQEIVKKLKECDLVVISCPVYFANVTAPVKNMFDRLRCTVMDDSKGMIPKPRLSSKQGYILMTQCSTPFPFDRIAGQSTGCLKAMNEVFKISGMKCKGKIVFSGTINKSKLSSSAINKIKGCFK